ncbi:MAG: hypothetical protein A2340_14550 [Lentisphaerae bacterium RIFOXYB12_FULL_60_10]|nr:MAG: hypothetical protein A2340_14550 [Lentisphaerae bacterium RIFOXYB12_FULL_60_10]
MKQFQPPYYGAAYYPEDWPSELVDADIRIMREIGMNCMRIGEFAWSSMEPREGHFEFDWLHRVVDKLGKAGIATVLGTPSCTPPAWLAERYPEAIIVDCHGVRRQHGARRHACPNSPVYRDLCARIVTRMGEEFGKDPQVIGWQLDNEVYPPVERGCCCPACHRKFQDMLRAKYGTIGALNAAWCNHLWSQDYDSFAQVPFPRNDVWHHPSLLAAWGEFVSDSYVDFCRHQADILHRLAGQPVGTDMMPFLGVAYEPMHRNLELVQFNHYRSTENLWHVAFWFDYIRTIKPHPYWNTETATAWNGSTASHNYKVPGFCRANTWLSYALGGEAAMYWLWREHWAGQELMHSAVIASTGRPLHMIDEVKGIAAGLKRSGAFLNGTRPTVSGLALHVSSKASFTFEAQAMTHGFKYVDRLLSDVYRPMIRSQLRPDVLDPAADLSPYRVVVTPFLPWLGESGLDARLGAWIRAGGTWIAGPMTDNRTADGAKFTHAPFGVLESWAGLHCKFQVSVTAGPCQLEWPGAPVGEGSLWFDAFEAKGSRVLARYADGPMAGDAAVVERRMGKGRVIVLGTVPDAESWAALVVRVCAEAKIRPVTEASSNVLVVPRNGKGGTGWVVVELQNETGRVTLPKPARDLLTGKTLRGELEVAPHGVHVLTFE